MIWILLIFICQGSETLSPDDFWTAATQIYLMGYEDGRHEAFNSGELKLVRLTVEDIEDLI